MPATAALRKTPREIAPQPKPQPKAQSKPRLFHARMLVTRVEEWCVEADTAEEAKALLTSGAGHRCAPGESVQVEFDGLLDD